MILGNYNIEAASFVVRDKIDLIEHEQFDDLFNIAYQYDLIPDVAYMLIKSGIEFLSRIDFIYPEMFKYCEEFETITIPNSINLIGRNSFNYNKKLKQVNFADNSNVQTVEKAAFANCENLQSISLPDSVELIEDYAFFKCSNLNHVSLPDKIDEINCSTFYNCFNLDDIKFPKSLRYIDTRAFSSCHFTDITLPPEIETIAEYAFENCKFLTNITINGTELKIRTTSFQGCLQLQTVTYNGSISKFQQLHGKQSWYLKKYTHASKEPKIICNDGVIDLNT